MKIIADKLRTLRKTRKLNQADVAKALGIPPTTYSNWEQGKAEPPLAFLVKIAEYYHCTADFLLGIDPAQTNQQISERLSTLPTEKRDALLQLLNVMEDKD